VPIAEMCSGNFAKDIVATIAEGSPVARLVPTYCAHRGWIRGRRIYQHTGCA
jgi:hypothetical protein